MQIEVQDVTPLRFDDGSPVRAASAVVPFGGGLLVAQDDATHAAWARRGTVTRLRVLPSVQRLDTFEEAAGTKHLKPDLEAAFRLPDHADAVVLLGSGSSPARMRASLVRLGPDGPEVADADLAGLYGSVARLLDVELDLLNLEGACLVGDALRWFQRGLPSAGVPTRSVDVDLMALRAALAGDTPAAEVPVRNRRLYDLGTIDGVGLAVTDAVALPDGSVLVSAAAEDTSNPRDDGPVVGSALAVLVQGQVAHRVRLPRVEGTVPKVEGLALLDGSDADVRLLATIDSDDPEAASLAVALRARW